MTRKLLILDDEKGFADFVHTVAEGLGYDVTTLNQSRDFEAAFDSVDPDMIVLDIVMPEIDGIEIVRWLAERGTRARIVLVSGYAPNYMRAGQALAEAAGVIDVAKLTKPVPLSHLRAALA